MFSRLLLIGDIVKKIKVKINTSNRSFVTETFKGRLLKDVFDAAKISYKLPCGGTGRCGKCKVRFLEGPSKVTSLDKSFFTEKELSQGFRLLCRSVVENDCEVDIADKVDEDSIVAESVDIRDAVTKEAVAVQDYDRLGIAVDIGTTTIAAALLGVNTSGESSVLRTASTVNHQRQYGDDVISRISYASDEAGLKKLNEIVIFDVKELVDELVSDVSREVSLMVITGNTTMLHIFRNISVESLGRYPYKTTGLDIDNIDFCGIKTLIMPGFTAFVGGDILSGVYYTGLSGEGEKRLLLDLGTNGEMAYYNQKELKICSTAAGPVFEGGTISCGVASVPGAISHIKIADEGYGVSYETIGNKAPIGLCGTGVMEAVSELVRVGIVSPEGLLQDQYFEEGFPVTEDGNIRIRQEDIRNVQLAKAAVHSGIKQLLDGDAPGKVFVSGGFGTNIDYDAIRFLKLFPESIEGAFVGAGNTALKGALKYLLSALMGHEQEKQETEKLLAIKESAVELILANKDDFDEFFVEAMNF